MDFINDNSLENNDKLDNEPIKKENNIQSPKRVIAPKKKKMSENIFLKNYKLDINSSTDKIPHLKKNKKKKSINKNYPFTSITKQSNNSIYEALINLQNNNNPINDIDIDKKNITFSANPGIENKLRKEYNGIHKNEKKHRKIKITTNLYDSFEDNEESNEDDEDDGFSLYISSDSIFIFIFDLLLMICSFYSIFFIPIDLAKKKLFCEKENKLSKSFKYYTEVIFIIDIFISSIRSYNNYEFKTIINTKKIMEFYLRHYFFLDLICCFPSYNITRFICQKKSNEEYFLSKSEITFSIFLFLKSFKIFKILNNKNNRVVELIYEKISNYYYFEQMIDLVINIIIYFSFFHILICFSYFYRESILFKLDDINSYRKTGFID